MVPVVPVVPVVFTGRATSHGARVPVAKLDRNLSVRPDIIFEYIHP
jgi:hypothetical protein